MSERSGEGGGRLYGDLAPWFHAVTHPDEYAGEAAHLVRIVAASGIDPAATLLELGAGGGNNAFHLKRRFACTLTDVSPAMLRESARINPECEHVAGDMRTLRLGRTFDVVLTHDAIGYMTSVADLGAAILTAALHTRPGGLAVFAPDAIAETFAAGSEHGGADLPDGRAARYLEWTHAPAPGTPTYAVDYAFLIREVDGTVRTEHDRHVLGLFPRTVWHDAFAAAGLAVLAIDADDPYAGEHVVFVTRKAG